MSSWPPPQHTSRNVCGLDKGHTHPLLCVLHTHTTKRGREIFVPASEEEEEALNLIRPFLPSATNDAITIITPVPLSHVSRAHLWYGPHTHTSKERGERRERTTKQVPSLPTYQLLCSPFLSPPLQNGPNSDQASFSLSPEQ